MKRSPTPGVIRYPGVTVIGHHPVSVGGVRVEVASGVGNPYTAIAAVVDPPSVRPQFIVENIEVYTSIIVIIIIGVIIIIIIIVIIIIVIIAVIFVVIIITLRICIAL